MWQAVCGVLALVIVATLNIGAMVALGGPGQSPAAQVLTTALWALQAPLAAILLHARGEKDDAVVSDDAGGANVFALSISYGITIFVLVQLTSFAFGGAIFYYDWATRSLCDSGHLDRCAQIPADALAASAAVTVIAGGLLAILVALLSFGISGYRVGWRARRTRWLGAILTPFVATLLMIGENLLSSAAFGADVDTLVSGVSLSQLLLARAPLFLAGVVVGLIGFALSLRVNRPARRYAFAVARASRRKGADPRTLKAEFLRVMGFSPDEYDLNVRRRQDGASATAQEDAAKT